MITLISRLLQVEHPDADVRRRGRNLILTSIGVGGCGVVLAGIWAVQANYSSAIAAVSVVIGAGAVLALSRSGKITVAALLLAALLLASIFGQILSTGSYINGGFYLLVPLLVAINTLTPRYFALVFALCFAGHGATTISLFDRVFSTSTELNAFQDATVLLVLTGIIGMISSFNFRSTTRESALAHAEIEAATAQLERANASLEQRVAERTQELAVTLDRERAQGLALQDSLERQKTLNDVINALSMPILPVRPDVIVAPLVGNIDTDRSEQLFTQLLGAIEQRRARVIILDVTGVAVIDTQLARTLLRLAAAARLLGTHTTLVGIRPEVAQTLVSLDADLAGLQTAATLYEGLRSL